MIKIFPLVFILLWSSAFITTKPIIDNSDPFSALAFRFSIVAIGFFLFSVYSKQKILINKKWISKKLSNDLTSIQPKEKISLLLKEKEIRERSLYWHFPAYLQGYTRQHGPFRTTPCGAVRMGDWKLIEYFEDGSLEQ